MKKIISVLLIIALSLALVVSIVACKEQNDTPPQTTDTPPIDGGDTPEPDLPEEPIPEPEIPVAEFTKETIDGVNYVFYGSMPQTVVSKEMNNVLSNLVATNQLAPNENGLYPYGDKEYTIVRGSEDTEGKRLSNGLYIERDGYYFFSTEKIRWRVLEEKNGEMLLFSESVLGSYVFNETNSYNALGYLVGTQKSSNDYAESALRTYITETLYNQIFSTREKASILEKWVFNRPGESAYPLMQGLDTSSKDKIHILSYWEIVDKYQLAVEENLLPCNPVSDYLVALNHKVERVGDRYYSDWWVRTCGSKINFGSRVTYSGVIGTATQCSVNLDHVAGIRPTILLKVQ